MFRKSFFYTLPLVIATGVSFALAEEDAEKSDSFVVAPFPNYWDANAWEADSGTNFWRDSTSTLPASEKADPPSTKTK